MASEQPAFLEREFYQSARGPSPGDIDSWRLVFDKLSAQLLVRHEWQSARHSGVDDFTIAEFLLQPGAAQDALLATLFGQTENPQNAEIAGEFAR